MIWSVIIHGGAIPWNIVMSTRSNNKESNSVDQSVGPNSIGDVVLRSSSPVDAPITARLYLSYGIGMIGERIFRDTPALLLLVFMTNYLAIPAAMAGVAIFIPKLLVVFVDPIVGILSDRIRSPWGRRRPLMFFGAILTSASFLLLFCVPSIENVWWRAAYMSLMICFAFMAYALFSVPYLSMASEMTVKPAEHTRLMSIRVVFMAVGLCVGGYAGSVVQLGGGGLPGYRVLAVSFGIVCMATMFVTVFGTSRARQCPPDGNVLSLLEQFRMARSNTRYLLLLSVNALQKIAEGVGYGSFAYFIIYFVHKPVGAIGTIIVGTLTGQVLSQPLWVWLNGRWSRVRIYTIGIAMWIALLFLWLALADAPTWQLLLMGLGSGISAGGFLSVMLMMLADSISRDAETSGVKREGTYSGIWLATEKIGVAFGALIVGGVLSLFHFVPSAAGIGAAEPREAVVGIVIVYVGMNAFMYAASIIPVWLYGRYSEPHLA